MGDEWLLMVVVEVICACLAGDDAPLVGNIVLDVSDLVRLPVKLVSLAYFLTMTMKAMPKRMQNEPTAM